MSWLVMIVVMHIFVKKKTEAENFVELLKEENEFYKKLSVTIRSLPVHSRRLLHDIDSNVVEQFHSVVVKFVGEKRINYSSYRARCHAAVVSFNTKRPHYGLHNNNNNNKQKKSKHFF
jgi:hypothetical protein